MNYEKKTYVEERFDAIIDGKSKITYNHDFKKSGVKDQQIRHILLNYGVDSMRCLDVGPGTGRWLQFLKANRADYLAGIDISGVVLDRVRELCDKVQKLDLEVEQFDFPNDNFDIILSFEVIEHLIRPDNYITEVMRVLKPGGIFVLSTPNIVSLISRFRMLFGLLPPAIASDRTHVRFFRQKELRESFIEKSAEIKFIPTSISLHPKKPKSRLAIRSNNMLSQFDDSILCVVRK